MQVVALSWHLPSGYVQENTLPTTLLRAVIAMLIGLFLARWWGLILQRQLSAAAIEKNEFIKRRANSVRRGGSIGNPKAEGTA